ncbi:uncharacterized protein ACA1_261490 [Acanthamoeba castellanii str. Neff]|uniref:Uncharacterized protein n=1 Tax=Acanthamoeba castellanii (strain ATCC 30010 / Neff) TaxID=1257118 RepID=L8GFU3_ACACF|nr:uncharacterized protein ACA1_261490 [Acanthamoeba castellanii str. Neff]ELR11729.1 hypothetical protein ACA1_261490 [Acanthamoeba castellanii str. Neff]
MLANKRFFLAVVALLALSAAIASGSNCGSKRVTRERIVEWHDKIYSTTNVLGAPGGGASGLRAWAMVVTAMFDAANLADDSEYASYLDLSGIPSSINVNKAEPLAAAAKAAEVVLNGLIPASASADVRNMLKFSHLSQLSVHLGALPDNYKTANGIALGEFVGLRMLANRTNDGHPPNNCNNWPSPATAACPNSVPNSTFWYKYQYDLPYFPGQPNSPGYPQVRPFAIPAYDSALFTVPAQPAPGTPQHLSDFAETYAFGTSNASLSARTAETDAIARFHDGNFGSQVGWAMDYVSSSGIDVDGVDLLRVLALAAISSHDAHATHWLYKYTHYNGRPIVAYRTVTPDSPAHAYVDPSWTPVLTTSQTPEHPSGHSARSGGACFAFIKAFGDVPPNGNFRTISYSQPQLGSRTYTSIMQFYQEVHNSRVYGGVHWRSALIAGQNLAEQVTNYAFGKILRRN